MHFVLPSLSLLPHVRYNSRRGGLPASIPSGLLENRRHRGTFVAVTRTIEQQIAEAEVRLARLCTQSALVSMWRPDWRRRKLSTGALSRSPASGHPQFYGDGTFGRDGAGVNRAHAPKCA